MANVRLKDKAEIGRSLADADLLFVTKTAEDTDNNTTFLRLKNQLTSYTTGITETLYSYSGHTHEISGVDNLQGSLDSKANISGTVFTSTIFAPTLSGNSIYSGSNNLNSIFAAYSHSQSISTIDNLSSSLSTKADLSAATFTNSLKSSSFSATTISGGTIYSGNTNIYEIFSLISHNHGISDINNLSASLATKADLSGDTFTGQINVSVLSATTLSASTMAGDYQYKICYLTYSGTSGTSSGTMGCTLTSNGNWTVTEFGTIYFCDDKDGNLTITIPDASASNEGKEMVFVKPRLVQSSNHVLVVTTGGQAIAETSTFYLRSANDKAQIVPVKYSSSGALTWKYRASMIDRAVHEVIEVSIGGTQLFSTIKSAVDYVNAYADGPRRIKVNPGTYYIDSTITINCPYSITIEGFGMKITNLIATSSLSGTPMFEIESECDFYKMTFSGTSGYGLVDDECCLDCSTPNLYFQVNDVLINGFYKGVELDGGSESWIFNSIIQNCESGIWANNSMVGCSEMTISGNTNGIYFSAGSTDNYLSIQNTIFNVESGQIGINYKDNSIKPQYHFATGNAFYGSGTYISGLTFTSKTQSDIRYENNVGLQNYRPEAWMWVSANTNSTTIGTQGTYSASTFSSGSIQEYDFIKFSGTGTAASFTYLPTIQRKLQFNISGDISVAANNQTLSVALYKNETRLQDIDVRTTTSAQPAPFSFISLNTASENDIFSVRVSNLAATNAPTLRTLMFAINTI